MIVWTTDPHLDFNKFEWRKSYYKLLNSYECPIIITGDVGSADSTLFYFTEMRQFINHDIYFIPGNHDYYGDSIKTCKQKYSECGLVNYIPGRDYWLIGDIALIGSITMFDPTPLPDTGLKNYDINDFSYINDLSGYDWHKNIVNIFNEELNNLKKSLQSIPDHINKVIVASHPILYKTMEVYGDKKLSKYFINESAGRLINEYVEDNQNKNFLVLCGHTHMKAGYRFDGLKAYSSKSEYGNPQISGLISDELKLTWKGLNIASR